MEENSTQLNIIRYLYGELDLDDSAHLSDQVVSDPLVASEFDEWRDLVHDLNAIRPETPPDLCQKVMRHLD